MAPHQGLSWVFSSQAFAADTCPAGAAALTNSMLGFSQSCTIWIQDNDLGQAIGDPGFSEPFSVANATGAKT